MVMFMPETDVGPNTSETIKGGGPIAMKTKKAEGIPAPMILDNHVMELQPHYNRLIGVNLEGDVKGITQVKKVGDLIEYRMIAAGKSEEIEKRLKELAHEPPEKIVEEIIRMTWTHKDWKRDNLWDIMLYFTKTGELAGVTINLPPPADPRTPFKYNAKTDDRAILTNFLNNEEVRKTLKYESNMYDKVSMTAFLTDERVKKALEL